MEAIKLRVIPRAFRSGHITVWVSIGLLGIAVGVGTAFRQFSSIQYTTQGRSQRSTSLDVEFDKFRKIMVRKNATSAIVEHSGMKLLEEQVQGVYIEKPREEGPVLNVLQGESKAELVATKQIIVQLNDPQLEADRLSLTQYADIQPGEFYVRTESNQPTRNLVEYQTTLKATADGDSTRLDLTVQLSVNVDVPRFFASAAERRVQQAAENAIGEQEAAIRELVAQHSDRMISLPELGR